MKFEAIAQLATPTDTAHWSSVTAGVLVLPADAHNTRTISLVIGARTNYYQARGNSASSFSFKGPDPGPYVEALTSSAAAKTEKDVRLAHVQDYHKLATTFPSELPGPLRVLRPLLLSIGSRRSAIGASPVLYFY